MRHTMWPVQEIIQIQGPVVCVCACRHMPVPSSSLIGKGLVLRGLSSFKNFNKKLNKFFLTNVIKKADRLWAKGDLMWVLSYGLFFLPLFFLFVPRGTRCWSFLQPYQPGASSSTGDFPKNNTVHSLHKMLNVQTKFICNLLPSCPPSFLLILSVRLPVEDMLRIGPERCWFYARCVHWTERVGQRPLEDSHSQDS